MLKTILGATSAPPGWRRMRMAASICRNVPYDVLQDFTPITMASHGVRSASVLLPKGRYSL